MLAPGHSQGLGQSLVYPQHHGLLMPGARPDLGLVRSLGGAFGGSIHVRDPSGLERDVVGVGMPQVTPIGGHGPGFGEEPGSLPLPAGGLY